MTDHDHATYVPGCYRCDLSRDEVTAYEASSGLRRALRDAISPCRTHGESLDAVLALVEPMLAAKDAEIERLQEKAGTWETIASMHRRARRRAEAERDEARAAVERVRARAEEWKNGADCECERCAVIRAVAKDLRRALAGDPAPEPPLYPLGEVAADLGVDLDEPDAAPEPDEPLPCGSCGEPAPYTIILGGRPMPACLRHLNHWQTPAAGYTCPSRCVEMNHPGVEHAVWLNAAKGDAAPEPEPPAEPPFCGHDAPCLACSRSPLDDHQPTRVYSIDGFDFIDCSCGGRGVPHRWLSDHWRGDHESGMAAVHAVIAQQARDAAPDPEQDHPPCCEECQGTGMGGEIGGPCRDCRGTGHPHPPAADTETGPAPEPPPCGHQPMQPGCGGCDPSAVEFVRDDGGSWRKPRPDDFAAPEQDGDE